MTTIDVTNLGTAGIKFIGLAANDKLGFRVTGPAGDLNGDGIDDLLLSTISTNGLSGTAYVVFGTRDGLPTDLGNLGTDGFTVNGAAGERLGRPATGIGDINGDGIDDVAVAAFAYGYGRTAVVFGGTGLSGDVAVDSIGAGGIVISGTGGNNDRAYQIAAAGDFNGDGINDLVIGAFVYSATANNSGAAFVVFGSDQGLPTTIDLGNLGAAGIKISGTAANQYVGGFTAGDGDVNGDGVDDIVIGTGVGSAHVFLGATGAVADTTVADADFTITGTTSASPVIAIARDVNGDGLDDILVGDIGYGSYDGVVYLIFGTAAPADVDVTALGGRGISIVGPAAATERVGDSVGGVQGDVNGDGYNDFVIGGAASANAYVIFGGPNLPSTIDLGSLSDSQGIVIADVSAANFFGRSMSGAGDVNGDGLADVRIGARYDDGGGNNTGAEYLIYGVFNASATAGDDTLTSGSLNDSIAGGDGGNDTLDGGDDSDELFGGAGNDLLIGGADASNDVLRGGDGNDSAFGQGGDDNMTGGDGADDFKGNLGNDILAGENGNDTLRGQVGNDTMLGNGDDDLVFGGGGDDSVGGSDGNDVVNGNSGADTVSGGPGNDTVRGQGGNDVVNGEAGDDLVLGISGLDSLFGGFGDDTLTGGVGNDQLTGGDGADVFQFGAMQGADTITDFEDGIDRMSFVGVSAIGDLTIVDTDDGAAITLTSEGSSPTLRVTLTNITAAQLDASDFIFS